MSSFIVSEKHMNMIYSYLLSTYHQESYSRLCNIWLDSEKNIKDYVQKLWDLNCKAFNHQYKENVEVSKIKFHFYPTTIYQALKLISCFLYNTEVEPLNNENDQNLYASLEKISNRLKNNIINSLEAYEKAKWAI